VAGATILGSGEVVMILSAADLMASLERVPGSALAAARVPEPEPATILVVEDSLTTRTLEKNILETAGFRVRVAADGAEAWGALQSERCDLVVSDIEMPRMDGLELTARIRADQRHRELPIVLVTSRDSREDRERSTRAGADAYIVKGRFDEDRLLETVRRLI
jgi:two-component system chemotaxis sensor kinase CheA